MPDHAQPVPLLSGHIDEITAANWVAGWAWDGSPANRLHVGVFAGEALVAEAVADRFRADLLQAGRGYGHCGFVCRLRAQLAGGAIELRLQDRRSGQPIAPARVVPLPEPGTPDRTHLFSAQVWSVRDVLACIDRFDLPRQCEEMGAERFVDVSYRFCLERWPRREEAESDRLNLQSGILAAEDLIRRLLLSDERRALGPSLPGAFDHRFPFRSFIGEDDEGGD
jgi:hypothetical protein